MRDLLRRVMDVLFWSSVGIAGVALVLISAIIPWGVYTRYVMNSAASWPEPAAILLAIVLTFFGAAPCYRAGVHMRVLVGQRMLPPLLEKLSALVAELLVGVVAVFMTIWGWELCAATWYDTIDAFPWLRVGITYMPIPIGGAITALFVLERVLIGPALHVAADTHAVEAD